MCLIIQTPDASRIPDTLIFNAALDNPHGFGMAWVEKNKLHSFRTMSPKGMRHLEAIRSLGRLPVIVHWRYATHGTRNLDNCHPFEVTKNITLMHNGIIPVKRTLLNRSDTYHFARYILKPILIEHPELFGTEELETLVMPMIGASKLTLLRNDGAVQIINRDAGMEYQGMWLSNSNSIDYVPKAFREWWTPQLSDDTGNAIENFNDLALMSRDKLREYVYHNPDEIADLIGDYLAEVTVNKR